MNQFPFVVSLTFVFSVIILGVVSIVKFLFKLMKVQWKYVGGIKKPLFPVSVVVVIIVSGVCLSFYGLAANRVWNNENNAIVLASDRFYTCELEVNRTVSDKVVILRLDDVQAYGWAPISIRMIRDARAMGMPVVAGVIPQNLLDDKRMVRFLKRQTCNIELAIHGFDHGGTYLDDTSSTGEFASLNKEQALSRLERGERILSEVTDSKPYSFIPPQNALSDESRNALLERAFPVLSGEGDEYFDYDAATWNFTENAYVPYDIVLEQCESSFAMGDEECVIMLHPQDFSNDDNSLNEERYQDYLQLLAGIQERGYSVVTFSDVVRQKGIAFTYVLERYSPDLAF